MEKTVDSPTDKDQKVVGNCHGATPISQLSQVHFLLSNTKNTMLPPSTLRICSLLLLTSPGSAAAEAAAALTVDVYSGPTDCPDDSKVQPGNHISLHYVGSIDKSSATGKPGKTFDSSRVRSEPVDVTIGIGKVIKGAAIDVFCYLICKSDLIISNFKGWDEGIVGLCVGSKANLIIPPELGYGHDGVDKDVPGGATLHFDIEVVSINAAPPERVEGNLFAEIDTDGNGELNESELEAYFKSIHVEEVPDEMWEHEDKNGDRIITWEEFSGPKGSRNPMGDEL